ncbi:MAG: hypothetical protein HN344_00510 [Gammaproteobacteria bacterium]|nr:hypothetical protein [Gammaproteobacteria bacterium]
MRVQLTTLLDLLFIMIFIALIQPKKASEFDQESVKKEIEESAVEEVVKTVETEVVVENEKKEDIFYNKVMVFNTYNKETNNYASTRTLFQNESGKCFLQWTKIPNGTRFVTGGKSASPMTKEEYEWGNNRRIQEEIGAKCTVELHRLELIVNFESGTTTYCRRGSEYERFLCNWRFVGSPDELDHYDYWEPIKVFEQENESILVYGNILYWTPPPEPEPAAPQPNRRRRY